MPLRHVQKFLSCEIPASTNDKKIARNRNQQASRIATNSRFDFHISLASIEESSFLTVSLPSDRLAFSLVTLNRSMFNKLASDEGKVSPCQTAEKECHNNFVSRARSYTKGNRSIKYIDGSDAMRCAEWCRCWYTCVHKIKRHSIYSLIHSRIAMFLWKKWLFQRKRILQTLDVYSWSLATVFFSW